MKYPSMICGRPRKNACRTRLMRPSVVGVIGLNLGVRVELVGPDPKSKKIRARSGNPELTPVCSKGSYTRPDEFGEVRWNIFAFCVVFLQFERDGMCESKRSNCQAWNWGGWPTHQTGREITQSPDFI